MLLDQYLAGVMKLVNIGDLKSSRVRFCSSADEAVTRFSTTTYLPSRRVTQSS